MNTRSTARRTVGRFWKWILAAGLLAALSGCDDVADQVLGTLGSVYDIVDIWV